MKSMKKLKKFKVCLAGKANVGKTAIYNVARDKPYNTVPHDDRDTIRIQAMNPSNSSETVELQLHDTAGMDRYNSLTSSYYRNARAIIMVFSLGCKESFSCVNNLVKDIHHNDSCPDSLFFLVGNKDDLNGNDLQVDDQTVHEYLSSMSWVFQKYMKTSAKENNGINELLNEVANSLLTVELRPSEQRRNLAEQCKESPVLQRNFWC